MCPCVPPPTCRQRPRRPRSSHSPAAASPPRCCPGLHACSRHTQPACGVRSRHAQQAHAGRSLLPGSAWLLPEQQRAPRCWPGLQAGSRHKQELAPWQPGSSIESPLVLPRPGARQAAAGGWAPAAVRHGRGPGGIILEITSACCCDLLFAPPMTIYNPTMLPRTGAASPITNCPHSIVRGGQKPAHHGTPAAPATHQ